MISDFEHFFICPLVLSLRNVQFYTFENQTVNLSLSYILGIDELSDVCLRYLTPVSSITASPSAGVEVLFSYPIAALTGFVNTYLHEHDLQHQRLSWSALTLEGCM